MYGFQRSRSALRAGLAGFVAATLIAGGMVSEGHAHKRPAPDCTTCHTCERPTSDHPCLKPNSCARHEGTMSLDADLGPDVTILDVLENLYEPVHFNHRAHAEMVGFSGGCETCHHFTPPNSPHPSCKDCHPIEIAHEDIAQPGLKGAYHRSCMSCHAEWDTDTACEVCHPKKGTGGMHAVPTHSAYEPIPLDELIIFDTEYETGDQVPFHHRNHSVMYERDCSECHREQSCVRCHVHDQELHPMGDLAEIDLHDTCFACHHEERCDDCHGRDPNDLFQHASTGWPLKAYHSDLRCRSCHGARGPFMKLEPRCETCHPGGWDSARFSHAVTAVSLDEVHEDADCVDCHEAGFGKAPDCSACHDDERVYDPTTGFGS